MPKVEMPKVEAFKAEPVKAETPAAETVKADPPPLPGKLLIMSPADRTWNDNDAAGAAPETASEPTSSKRRMSAMAAVVALAAVAGALGGALATAGLGYMVGGTTSEVANASLLESQVERIEADIVALKASVEHSSKLGMSQFNKTSDRLDKVEKAQVEPAAKLAKLSEAVDKLRAQQAPAPVAAGPRRIQGSHRLDRAARCHRVGSAARVKARNRAVADRGRLGAP